MKILHHIESADVSFRVPWVDLMRELGRGGVEQALLCRAGGNMERAARAGGIETRTWRPAMTNFPPLNPQYPFILRRVAPDLVHTRLSSAANIAGFWGRALGVPVIAALDGAYKAKYYRRADHYTACSQWAKEAAVSGWGVDPRRVDVVYNSIDAAKYRRGPAAMEAREKFRAERGVRPGERVFAGAGAFVPEKGFGLLIRAFARLARRAGDVRLLIAGDGPLRGEYAGAIRALGLGERALLSDGYASDIRPWLWGADFFVLPSRCEPFGIILLEAMAAGLPAIVTDGGGPAEVLSDGRNGLVTPAGDEEAMAGAMERLLHMEEGQRAALTAAAESRLGDFTGAALAARQAKIYERVLDAYFTRRGRRGDAP